MKELLQADSCKMTSEGKGLGVGWRGQGRECFRQEAFEEGRQAIPRENSLGEGLGPEVE